MKLNIGAMVYGNKGKEKWNKESGGGALRVSHAYPANHTTCGKKKTKALPVPKEHQ